MTMTTKMTINGNNEKNDETDETDKTDENDENDENLYFRPSVVSKLDVKKVRKENWISYTFKNDGRTDEYSENNE